jgi:hypothetical protein
MKWWPLAERRLLARAYQAIFAHADARVVLADLAIFCRETSTAVDEGSPIDPLTLAREEGKRAVWLRIKNLLAIDRSEIEIALRAHRNEILATQRSIEQQARTEL